MLGKARVSGVIATYYHEQAIKQHFLEWFIIFCIASLKDPLDMCFCYTYSL